MTIEEILIDLEKQLLKSNVSKITTIWNKLFPEEKMEKEALKESSNLKDELCEIIVEELELFDKQKIIKYYNYISEEKINLDDVEVENYYSNSFNDEE